LSVRATGSRRAACLPRVLLIAFALLLPCLAGEACAQEVHADDARAHVVFLLGTDTGSAGFFTAAQAYFRATDAHAEIVGDVHSLAQLREELRRRAGAHPWGRIVLVAHGTQWTGLITPIFAHGTAATLSALQQAHASGEFPPLPGDAIDANTELVVESCGLGRRADYLRALATLLAGDNDLPQVTASRNLVWFGTDAISGVPARRELPYQARVVRGSVAASAAEPIGRELRVALAEQAIPEGDMSTLVLPVRVHIAAARAELARWRRLEDYVERLPAGRIDLNNAGLSAQRLVWQSRPAGADNVDLIGAGTLVLAMQSAPDALQPIIDSLEWTSR